MSAQKWAVENIVDTSVNAVPPDKTADLLAEVIDLEAVKYDAPPQFRNSVYNIIQKTESLNLDYLSVLWACERMELIFSALQYFRNPRITIDAFRILAGVNIEQGISAASLARKHKISRPAMYRRVRRLAKYLGVDYRYQLQHNKTRPTQREVA